MIEKMTARDLKRFAILGELSEDDRQALFDLLEPKIVRRGRSIYRQTAEAEELIFVVSGTVHLTSRLAPELAPVAEGQVLGIASLFAPGPREATAKAGTDCELLLLSRIAYRRLVEDAPGAATRLTEGIATELAGLLREGLNAIATVEAAQ